MKDHYQGKMKFALHIGLALASLASAVDEKGAMGLSCVNLDDKVIPVDLAWVSQFGLIVF